MELYYADRRRPLAAWIQQIMKYPITLKVQYEREVHTIQTYEGEYRSLMVLLYDKLFIEDFGECGGMGRCGTCLIKILNSGKRIALLNRNEQDRKSTRLNSSP